MDDDDTFRDISVAHERAPPEPPSPPRASQEPEDVVAPAPPQPLVATPPVANHHQYHVVRIMTIVIFFVIVASVAIGLPLALISSHQTEKHTYKCEINIGIGDPGINSIVDALDSAPSYSPVSICIHVPTGEYRGSITIGHEKTNVVFVGDGVENTTLTSDSPATLTVLGQGFMARDLTVKNTATDGVAVDNGSEKSVFYRSELHGSGRALLLSGKRQFYGNCKFYGSNLTVSGYSDTFFQRCEFFAEKENQKDKVYIVGDSRDRLLDQIALRFHLCRFSSATPSTTFLGAALMPYPRMIVLQSYLDAEIAGYVDERFPTDGYFGIFGNQGPGSERSVPPSIEQFGSVSVASSYSLRSYLAGDDDSWVLHSQVEVELDLSS